MPICDTLQEMDELRVLSAGSTAEARLLLAGNDIHIILLGMPSSAAECRDLCRYVRTLYTDVPPQIVLLVSLTRQSSALDLLSEGAADDFITTPISPMELRMRVRAAARRWSTRRQTTIVEPDHVEVSTLRQKLEQSRVLNQELKKTIKELQLLASVDVLTGLANRRALFHRIGVEIERSLRLRLPLSGIMMDIDHFKSINDTYGHSCGDSVIQEIGNLLNGNLRKYDFAGRYGGEEFFIILPNTQLKAAMRIAERFRTALDKANFLCNITSARVTISQGVAQFRFDETKERWLARTDTAMYRAKQQGGDRVAADNQPSVVTASVPR